MRDCPFCHIEASAHVARNGHAYAIRDGYPVSAGHTLIIPHRHVATWFDATPDEQAAMLALAAEVKGALDAQCQPDGYNLGLNVGEAKPCAARPGARAALRRPVRAPLPSLRAYRFGAHRRAGPTSLLGG